MKAAAAPAVPLNAAAAFLKAESAAAAPLKAAAAPLKAAAIEFRCPPCTAPDVDVPATGGLVGGEVGHRCCPPLPPKVQGFGQGALGYLSVTLLTHP